MFLTIAMCSGTGAAGQRDGGRHGDIKRRHLLCRLWITVRPAVQ
jgi:hypothetical protein